MKLNIHEFITFNLLSKSKTQPCYSFSGRQIVRKSKVQSAACTRSCDLYTGEKATEKAGR